MYIIILWLQFPLNKLITMLIEATTWFIDQYQWVLQIPTAFTFYNHFMDERYRQYYTYYYCTRKWISKDKTFICDTHTIPYLFQLKLVYVFLIKKENLCTKRVEVLADTLLKGKDVMNVIL